MSEPVAKYKTGSSNVALEDVDFSAQHSKFPISEIGLDASYGVLLDGIPYSPESVSSIVQSLGPLTNLLYLRTQDPQYNGKFKDASTYQLAHIPGHTELLDFVSILKNMT